MSNVTAVIGEDESAVLAHVARLRERGKAARGMSLSAWDGKPEPGVSVYVVLGGADLVARVKKIAGKATVEHAEAKIAPVTAKAKAKAKADADSADTDADSAADSADTEADAPDTDAK